MRTTGPRSSLLSIDQVADHLGISIRTVRDLIASGALPVVRVGSRVIRVAQADLEAYINERRERRN